MRHYWQAMLASSTLSVLAFLVTVVLLTRSIPANAGCWIVFDCCQSASSGCGAAGQRTDPPAGCTACPVDPTWACSWSEQAQSCVTPPPVTCTDCIGH
jgi:hypothetical protein